MEQLTGSFVAIVAPMKENRVLDLSSFSKLMRIHKREGTRGVVVNGTTGESVTLDRKEKDAILEAAVKEVKGSSLVIAGTGTNNTVTTLSETKRAFDMGADACLLIAPYYNKPTQKGLYQHFLHVADNASGPIILYNHPGRTGVNLEADTVASLSEHENIVGIKDACSDIDRFIELGAKCQPGFSILTGDDAVTCQAVAAGAQGVISVAANIIPSVMETLVSESKKKSNDAYDLNEKLMPLFDVLNIEINPTPIKWAMHSLGLIESGIRLPLLPLSSQYREELDRVLHELGITEKVKEFS